MPPHEDDRAINNDQRLWRALPNWITAKDGRERPKSESLTDSSYENSCFVEGEITLEEIVAFLLAGAQQQEDAMLMKLIEEGLPFALLPVGVVREAGFIVERRPEEADGCANPNAHVVVGPAAEIRRKDYERSAKKIVKHEAVTIIRAAPQRRRS